MSKVATGVTPWSAFVQVEVDEDEVVDVDAIVRLGQELQLFDAVVSGGLRRYDAQLTVTATDAGTATVDAIAVLQHAAGLAGLSAGRVVAVEVLTEADLQARLGAPGPYPIERGPS